MFCVEVRIERHIVITFAVPKRLVVRSGRHYLPEVLFFARARLSRERERTEADAG